MKRLIVFACSVFWLVASAQTIRTIVPSQPVTVGTAFQVQYIITGGIDPGSVTPPPFDSLVLVSGPNYYHGTALIDGRQQAIQNISYTLMTATTGRHKIGGLKAQFKNGSLQQGNDALILVVPAAKASFHSTSSYTDVHLYAPLAEDRERLVDDNIFVRAATDKKTCYVGEPVTASFTLYSRLQSTSEVVNSPSLYGFSVIDMLDIRQEHTSVETIHNQVFNTAILRQLQLYPGQSGDLTIDGMQLQNEVEFEDADHPGRTVRMDKSLTSPPVIIHVKPLPAGQPEDFTGAVGQFSIAASLPQVMKASATGQLVISIKGSGNFLQFAPPSIQWPAGLDVLDPVINDSLDSKKVPEEGTRTYTYRFTVDSAGTYMMPPVQFSFFNPAANHYDSVSTNSLSVQVEAVKGKDVSKPGGSSGRRYIGWLLVFLLIVLAARLLYRYKHEKKKKAVKKAVQVPPFRKDIEALYPLPAQQAGMELSRILFHADKEGQIKKDDAPALRELMDECRLLAYADMSIEGRKEELIARALKLLPPGS